MSQDRDCSTGRLRYETDYCHGCKHAHTLRHLEWCTVIGKHERVKRYCRPQWDVRRQRLLRAINRQVELLRAIFADEPAAISA
jgi:hypothetical protein